ncbi:class I SAM-dependent methyltransferase [Maioricimonas rarisocia]|uniref:class I SAM-dependent methyltransferase n=1 Tax=Maioricimonas rarisocia TaxID=2528026 RepID=UPI0018D20D92|nr:SAM-dependent methyltransferase [Maioricimonas rarisocia]
MTDVFTQEWMGLVEEAVRTSKLILLVLSKPVGSTADGVRKLSVRPVTVSGKELLQWTSHEDRRESHENLDSQASLTRLREIFPERYRDLNAFTTEGDLTARSNRKGRVRVTTGPPTKQPSSTAHNRQKQYLIPEGVPCPFLEAIGVMTPAGRVKANRYNKFRQINRFVEFIDNIYDALPAEGAVRVVDFGCGKSYLTFAIHHYLQVIRKRDVQITGLDRNPEVIRDCREVAERLDLEGLEFFEGDIVGHTTDGPVDLAVSLHACDTATDDALARAVQWEASVILSVPCCQHEVADQLECDELSVMTRHGILKERLAAMATDALRASALEIVGYRAAVIEFIDMEHTPKNLLIRAVRRDESERLGEQSEAARHEFDAFKQRLGIERLAIEDALLKPPRVHDDR